VTWEEGRQDIVDVIFVDEGIPVPLRQSSGDSALSTARLAL
jgi:hypothetical protein